MFVCYQDVAYVYIVNLQEFCMVEKRREIEKYSMNHIPSPPYSTPVIIISLHC